jgi:hypothetical protein
MIGREEVRMEAYTWVARQVGTHGVWEPYQLAGLPYPPDIDDKVTIQRWATPACQLGDTHKAAFTLDFDAHADWLTVAVCLDEVRRFLAAFSARWGLAPELLLIAFSGRAGFHVTIPATLLGDIASPHLTTAYKHWATNIKDALGLITLDAPSRRTPEWWWACIQKTLGWLPPAVQDRAAFALSLRRVGIYTRRRMLRREGSQHPGSGRYKIPLLPHELAQDAAAIATLAEWPRIRPSMLAPPTHAGLAAHLQLLLADVATQATRRQAEQRQSAPGHRGDLVLRDDIPALDDDDAPLCVRRILALPAPDGSSNMPLINLLAYWRMARVAEADAIGRATAWLLGGVADPQKRAERWDSARSIGRAVYAHRYQFRRHFIAPLQVVADDECAACPLRAPCWSAPEEDTQTHDHHH